MSTFDDLAEQLQAVADELDDRSFELLRRAVAEGELERPKPDKVITQARRAIEKAIVLLRRADSGAEAVEGVDQEP